MVLITQLGLNVVTPVTYLCASPEAGSIKDRTSYRSDLPDPGVLSGKA